MVAELSKPAAQPSADVKVSPDVKNAYLSDVPLEHVMQGVIEAQPEAWKRAHLVCRDDQHYGYVVGSTVVALANLVQDMVT